MRGRRFIQVCGKDVEIQGRIVRIARLDGEQFVSLDDPAAAINSLRKAGTRIDLFTFLHRLAETFPKYNYLVESDNLAVLPVSTFDHWWTKQVDSKLRNMVRKAEKKGVELREVPFDDTLLGAIREIYNECPIRQGRPFPHYGMSLESAREYAGTFLDRSTFIGAFIGDSMIGFVKLVTDEPRMHAHLLHILSMLKHRDKAPTNALIAHAVQYCADRDIRYLVYDHFDYGTKSGDSLSEFKEANGFRRVDLPRYYAPLTLFGWVAFHLGLHRRLIDHLPEAVAAKLRELRSAWYSRKLQSLTQAS
jgi:hypothetical protein